MEAVLVTLFVFAVIYLVTKDNKNETERTTVRVHRHGHRCYIEHLNEAEREIVTLLASNLDHKEYYIFNNIILPSENSVTTQVDHVIASRYGIFVIESKRYGGWIYAHKDRKEWTQTVRGGNKYQLYNPILQNFAHVSALKQQLPFVQNRFFSAIVFSGECEFKTPRIKNVFYEHELIDFIKEQSEVKLKEVELLVVIGKLSMLCQTNEVTNEQHVLNVVNTLAQNKDKVVIAKA